MSARERSLEAAGRVAVVGLLVGGTILASVDPFTFLFFAAYMAAGAVLVVLRPRNVVGWLLVAIAFGFIATTTPPDLDISALLRGDATARDNLLLWIGAWAGMTTYLGFLALTIVFPNGRLPADRGRRTSIILLVAAVMILVLAAVAPTVNVTLADGTTTIHVANPLSVLRDLPIWSVIPADGLWAVMVVLMAIGVVRLVLRYRRSSGVERLQLRWLVAALSFVMVALVVGLLATAVVGDQIGGGAWIPAIVAFPTIPLAVGVAVMRYRLLEIDRIISRTIGWSLVTGVLITVFAGAVIGLQAALSGFTQGQTLAVAASTLVAFALFQPVRRRVQTAVDRRFDRSRYDGERVVAAFSEQLRRGLDLQTLAAEVNRVATESVRPTKVAVWLRTPSRDPSHPMKP